MADPRQPITPLRFDTPIVDPAKGTPTTQFIRLWQQLFGNETGTNEGLAAVEATANAAQLTADTAQADVDAAELEIDALQLAAVPTGGALGEVLTKDSATDYDFSWQPGGGGPGGSSFTLNPQSGATYTTVLTDKDGVLVVLSFGSLTLVTIPLNASVAYPVGSVINFAQTGAGPVTILGDVGVTVNATPGRTLRTQYSTGRAIKMATDSWILDGDLDITVNPVSAMNPADTSANIILSFGDRTVTKGAAGSWSMSRSVTSRATGLYYFEILYVAGGDGIVGLAAAGANLNNFVGSDTFGAGYRPLSSAWFGTSAGTNAAISGGDIVCVAVDLNNRTFWMRTNGGNWNGSALNNPVTNVGGAAFNSSMPGAVFAAISVQSAGQEWTINTGQVAFAQSPPAGFSAWG